MKGIHPDVVFGEAAKAMNDDPYVRAMAKLREAFPAKRNRELRDLAKDFAGLTKEELEAINKVMAH